VELDSGERFGPSEKVGRCKEKRGRRAGLHCTLGREKNRLCSDHEEKGGRFERFLGLVLLHDFKMINIKQKPCTHI
jgi:hypothetical protein